MMDRAVLHLKSEIIWLTEQVQILVEQTPKAGVVIHLHAADDRVIFEADLISLERAELRSTRSLPPRSPQQIRRDSFQTLNLKLMFFINGFLSHAGLDMEDEARGLRRAAHSLLDAVAAAV